MKNDTNKTGPFGPIYTQFENKPKEAINYLLQVKAGEAKSALYRKEIGFVDIVYGRHNHKTERGYGLIHIIKSHQKEISQLGFKIEDFIPFVFSLGKIKELKNKSKIYIDTVDYRVILVTEWKGTPKKLLLTAFDLRPISIKNPKRLKKLKKFQK